MPHYASIKCCRLSWTCIGPGIFLSKLHQHIFIADTSHHCIRIAIPPIDFSTSGPSPPQSVADLSALSSTSVSWISSSLSKQAQLALVSQSSALLPSIFPPPLLSLSLFFLDEVVVLYQSSQWITHPFLLKVISAVQKADKLCVYLSCDSETEEEADVLSDRTMRCGMSTIGGPRSGGGHQISTTICWQDRSVRDISIWEPYRHAWLSAHCL